MLVLEHFRIGDHGAQRRPQLMRQLRRRRHLFCAAGREPMRDGRRAFVGGIVEHADDKQALPAWGRRT